LDISLNFEKYIRLHKNEAFVQYCDEKNLKSFRYYTVIIAIFFLISTVVHFFRYDDSYTIFTPLYYLFFLLVISGIRIFYRRFFNLNNIRRTIYIFLISLIVVLIAGHIIINSVSSGRNSDDKTIQKTEQKNTGKNNSGEIEIKVSEDDKGDSYTDVIFMFCVSILFFRFTRNELTQLFLIGFGIPLIVLFFLTGGIHSENIPNLVFSVIFFLIAYSVETKRRKTFLKQYDYFLHRHSDNIRIKSELNYAREMQLSMLPEKNTVIEDVEISAVSVPATEVGGDYFDYFKISDSKIGIFICDVSGHGVVSALLLSGLRSCMHLILEETSNPREVFYKLNRMIRKTQSRKMFVTAIFAVIDIKKNTCSLFNAGHLPPYKISGESGELFKIRKHGITLGATDELEKSKGESEVIFEFKKNDKLILYTDGLTEAINSFKEEFGFERLEHFLNANPDVSPGQLLDNLNKHIEDYTKDTPQKDDLTMIVVGRL